jgi:hypothetical protein
MAKVFMKLDGFGIEPLAMGPVAIVSDGLVERIRRRAETLRAQWQREQEDEVAEQELAAQPQHALAAD